MPVAWRCCSWDLAIQSWLFLMVCLRESSCLSMPGLMKLPFLGSVGTESFRVWLIKLVRWFSLDEMFWCWDLRSGFLVDLRVCLREVVAFRLAARRIRSLGVPRFRLSLEMRRCKSVMCFRVLVVCWLKLG